MKKIIVNSWDDLGEYVEANEIQGYSIHTFKGIEIKGNLLVPQVVDLFNILGGNFEYKPVEVIVTYEDFFYFLKKVAADDYLFDGYGFYHKGTEDEFDYDKLEEKYNVDLQILKK